MELEKLHKIEQATWVNRGEILRLGVSILFMVGIMLYVSSRAEVSIMLVVAGIIGGYMALNIGANDVANNVGPAVGSRALTLTGAIVIAAVFEAGGALIAGGDVVSTIKKGIIDPALIADTDVFIWLMMAALLAGALWLNFATAVGAPVSTTHSIVGGVLGAGVAAGGWNIVDWDKMAQIAASWVISPLIGGIIGAAFLYFIKRTVTYKPDMLDAAKRMVPLLVAIMGMAFGSYLMLKGLKKIWKVDFAEALMIGFAVAVVIYAIARPWTARQCKRLTNDKQGVNQLFTIPLIFAAALLSFAHGANDVANSVGPLAAINDALSSGDISSKAQIPMWVMMVGAIGIALGLALYGPKLIKTVGSEITELDQTRAFCIALSAAITVIIASQLGLPVSSTHIAVGAIFGVGFLREYIKTNYSQMVGEIERHHQGADKAVVETYMEDFKRAGIEEKAVMLQQLKEHSATAELTKEERKDLKKVYRHELVKRSALLKIATAWVITVPVSGLLAAILFFTIRGMMLP
ncbi:MAG: inorganic phosphate transporter [Gammaproteobacteria bacterium]|nr:inorganic phosphate transporter [Gammaproteobacteria bacterium]